MMNQRGFLLRAGRVPLPAVRNLDRTGDENLQGRPLPFSFFITGPLRDGSGTGNGLACRGFQTRSGVVPCHLGRTQRPIRPIEEQDYYRAHPGNLLERPVVDRLVGGGMERQSQEGKEHRLGPDCVTDRVISADKRIKSLKRDDTMTKGLMRPAEPGPCE